MIKVPQNFPRTTIRVTIAIVCMVWVSFALSSCMSSAPSSFPTMRVPSQQSQSPQSRMPSQQPQSRQSNPQQTPSQSNRGGSPSPGSPMPTLPGQQGTGRSSMPMPSQSSPTNPSGMPTPQVGGTPQPSSIPSPASPSSSSQQGGNVAFPSIPGLPDMTSGDKSRSEAQEDSGGLDQDQTTAQNQSGLPGGPLRTAESESSDQDSSQEGGLVDQRSGDERLSGSKDGAESGKDLGRLPSVGVGEQPQGGQERKTGENSGAGLLGEQSQNTPETDGWVLSNELPETEKVRPGIPEVDDVDQVDESGIAETDKELEETLAGIDGSIMSDREEYTSKVNKRAGGMELPGDVVASSASNINDGRDQGTKSGGTSTTAIPNPTYPGRHSQQVPEKPNPAPIGAADIPDAKDDDVVARQLREAALAETDPNLRAALWDELRRYLNKRK